MTSDVAAQGRAARRRAPAGSPPPFPPAPWLRRYAAAVVVSDVVAVAVVVPTGIWLELGTNDLNFGDAVSPWLPLVSGLLTIVCLLLGRAWDPPVLGQGSEELSRLVRAVAASSVVLGMGGLALQIPSVRPWAFGLIPAMGVLSLVGRYALRRRLHAHRFEGRCVHPALAVGSVESISDLVDRTRRERSNGWVVHGACTPGGGADGVQDVLGVPVIGDLDAVAEVVRTGGYRVVAIGRAPGWTPRRLHQLAWDLEGLGADLVVDPGLMEVAGPRLHVAPVDGLPLLRLTQPSLTGLPRVVKAVIDRIGAAVVLALVTPLLLAIAVAVRADGGPVFFRQTRVGRHGRTFTMIKFRSMVPDAEARRRALVPANDGDGPLFKLRADPRVTRVGALLRRYSLDELPQLFNVLGGSMSLIGPRPPLPEEVATYDRTAKRKLRVRPGLTGLWQVSGRSDLSWEESVRLDLRYVENWSLALDALILWKTVGAVLRSDGAY
ncbi:sugar transferase [Pseudonocardia petroleophila]|nr:sugar transferase [Pseudonocardia petroleophila]